MIKRLFHPHILSWPIKLASFTDLFIRLIKQIAFMILGIGIKEKLKWSTLSKKVRFQKRLELYSI